jgi:hypothetical protein
VLNARVETINPRDKFAPVEENDYDGSRKKSKGSTAPTPILALAEDFTSIRNPGNEPADGIWQRRFLDRRCPYVVISEPIEKKRGV